MKDMSFPGAELAVQDLHRDLFLLQNSQLGLVSLRHGEDLSQALVIK